MPTYKYEHTAEGCKLGKIFTCEQPIQDAALAVCPECGGKVERIIGPVNVSSPTSNSELRDKGFAKLVRRDDGVYENLTALDGESKIWDASKPKTAPDLKRRNLD